MMMTSCRTHYPIWKHVLVGTYFDATTHITHSRSMHTRYWVSDYTSAVSARYWIRQDMPQVGSQKADNLSSITQCTCRRIFVHIGVLWIMQGWCRVCWIGRNG